MGTSCVEGRTRRPTEGSEWEGELKPMSSAGEERFFWKDQGLGCGCVLLELLRGRAGTWTPGLPTLPILPCLLARYQEGPGHRPAGLSGTSVSHGRTVWRPLWLQAEMLQIEQFPMRRLSFSQAIAEACRAEARRTAVCFGVGQRAGFESWLCYLSAESLQLSSLMSLSLTFFLCKVEVVMVSLF